MIGVLGLMACLGAAAAPSSCPEFGRPLVRGRLADLRTPEVSGLVASRSRSGLFWAHNDSGDSARLFVVGESGRVQTEVRLEGLEAADWEDIAIGPGSAAGRDDLYVGEIGNNCECRGVLTIHRVTEPLFADGMPTVTITGSRIRSFSFRYADRPERGYNAEALLVDPRDGRVYVVTKESGPVAGVYEIPMARDPGTTVMAPRVGDLRLEIPDAAPGSRLITAGDISADGGTIVLISYTHGFLWRRQPGESILQALARRPCALPPIRGGGAEAVALNPTGDRVWTASEGVGAVVYEYARGRPAPSRGRSTMLDDFNDGDMKNRSRAAGVAAANGGWGAACDDYGASVLHASVIRATSGGRVLKLAGRVGPARDGKWTWAKCRAELSGDGAPVSLTSFRGIRFRARSVHPASMRLQFEGVVNGRDVSGAGVAHEVRFLAVPEWRTFEFDWNEFCQPGWACPGADCVSAPPVDGAKALAWSFSERDADADLELDDVALLE